MAHGMPTGFMPPVISSTAERKVLLGSDNLIADTESGRDGARLAPRRGRSGQWFSAADGPEPLIRGWAKFFAVKNLRTSSTVVSRSAVAYLPGRKIESSSRYLALF